MNRFPLLIGALVTALAFTPATLRADPRTGTADRARVASAARSYNRARQDNLKYRGQVRRGMTAYKNTGNSQQKLQAQQAAIKAGKAQVRMLQAQVKGLKAKAAKAIQAGHPDKANQYLDKAATLEKQAKTQGAKLDRLQAKLATAGATTTASQIADGPEAEPTTVSTAPEPPQPQAESPSGIASAKGRRTAKLQLRSGSLAAAAETYKDMEARPNRSGVMGLVDGYRKWSTRRAITKQSQRAGKQAARSGDLELASEAVAAIRAVNQPGSSTNRKVASIATQSLKGAKAMAKDHRPEEAAQMLSFARAVQKSIGIVKPTLRFRMVRRTAHNRLWQDLKVRAKQGNMEAFRSAMRLASAYAKEDGKPLTKGDLRTIRKLYMTTMKNSVPRALKDAQLLLSGQLGGVSVEEAANRYLYAMDMADKLARRGVEVKTSLFQRSLSKEFARTRQALVKAIKAQETMFEAKQPGLVKRMIERITKPPQARAQHQVAPMDSVWVQRQQREAAAQAGAGLE